MTERLQPFCKRQQFNTLRS